MWKQASYWVDIYEVMTVEKDLLETAAIDLGISRFYAESDTQFNNRVIYSAMACWIKTVCQDQPIDGVQSDGVSRRHIHDKCNRILSAFLCRYPSSELWFAVEDANIDAVGLLRSRLLRHQELINVGFNTNVSLTSTNYVYLSDGLEVVRGMLFLPGARYNGIALTRRPVSPGDLTKPDIITADMWFDAYAKSAWWEFYDASKEENLEYFNARKATSNMYKCWETAIPKVKDKYMIIRRPVNVTSHEYLILNTQNGKMHRIDPVLKDFGEHRRFMFGLRAAAGNPVPGQIIRYQEHIHLKIRTYLPAKETQLLETFAWPHNSINDRLEWDMSIPVWDYISPFLTTLGMEIREENHG